MRRWLIGAAAAVVLALGLFQFRNGLLEVAPGPGADGEPKAAAQKAANSADNQAPITKDAYRTRNVPPDAAPNAYLTTQVSLRGGPSPDFPAVVAVPAQAYVTIYACSTDLTWGDVTFGETRGWVSADYIRPYYQNRYMTVQKYVPLVRLPTGPFDVRQYW